MSLYALPVSASDLTQLQLGIEFFSNTTEATAEAALITNETATVSSYANQLLANNISLSQVAMAVDSLMFGVTDNTTELGKLSTQFLPKQVAAAVANGFNPTVYAAEALGLGLAGGNGTSNAFATDFGSLSAAQFASEVAKLTGINSTAIQGFVENWINFYTTHPTATGSLSVTLAAYGAAFGDAVGAALLNPTVNGDIALLVNAEQNALIDNAEGIYKVGIPLIAEPPHIPLSSEALRFDPNPPPSGVFDWAQGVGPEFNYGLFAPPAQGAPLTITNTPSTFTLNTQHFATSGLQIDAAGNHGNLMTLIVGDSTAGENFGPVDIEGYSTVHIVANGGDSFLAPPLILNSKTGLPTHLVVSGSGSGLLNLGASLGATEGPVAVGVNGGTITDVGQQLFLGATDAEIVDASHAPVLGMLAPASMGTVGQTGITVLGGTSGNQLQGSLGGKISDVTFSNGTTGVYAQSVGADNITGGPGGNDLILGDGGADTIALPANHSMSDSVGFGYDVLPAGIDVLAITDGSNSAYPGFWGVTGRPNHEEIGPNGGTSADMTTITGFHAGTGGDRLIFDTAAWNGESNNAGIASALGDLVNLDGMHIAHNPNEVAPVV
jgi:hypothetical protein